MYLTVKLVSVGIKNLEVEFMNRKAWEGLDGFNCLYLYAVVSNVKLDQLGPSVLKWIEHSHCEFGVEYICEKYQRFVYRACGSISA